MKQHNREVRGELVRSILLKVCDIKSRECKLLRVLDADENDYLAQAFGNVNLRYLARNLMPNSLWDGTMEIPTSACQLIWNLQTLIIKRGFPPSSLVVAPLEIWKMRQLRHIKCWKVYLPDPRPRRNKQYYMENLQTLKTALNLRLTEKVCEIIPNIKKLHLIYNVDMRGYDYSFTECLHNLDRCTLHRWYADNSHFPVLEKLVLHQLDYLKEIPLEIGEIPTLGLIRVEYCSISAAISAVKIKKDQVENQDNDALQIEVGVHGSDLESFKERLEAEELGLDLFKLDIFSYV